MKSDNVGTNSNSYAQIGIKLISDGKDIQNLFCIK